MPSISGLRRAAPGLVITAVAPTITTVSSTKTPSGQSSAAGTSIGPPARRGQRLDVAEPLLAGQAESPTGTRSMWVSRPSASRGEGWRIRARRDGVIGQLRVRWVLGNVVREPADIPGRSAADSYSRS